MTLPPLKQINVQHPGEDRVYPVDAYNSWDFCEFVNREQSRSATRFVVNVGANDGKSYDDPCYPLFERGYSGVAIEGTENLDLARNLPSPDVRKLTNCLVTPQNIAEILSGAATPRYFDFLKVDIDGFDGPVLAAILERGYRPKLIQAEINPEIPPPLEFSVMYAPNYRCQDDRGCFTGFYGMSLGYASRIAVRYGYHIIHMDNITPATHDIVLARNDLTEVLGSNPDMSAASLRTRYLDHPPTLWSHFGECGFDSFAWRYRTDYTNLAIDVWNACMISSAAKHQRRATPFYFGVEL